MNTNVQISLTDDQRDHLKNLIDGKKSTKKISRQEVKDLIQHFVDNLLETTYSDANVVVKQTTDNLNGFKFYQREAEIDFKQFVKFSCDDCGCHVSVADARLKQLPDDETGLGQHWVDALPKDVNWG